jgi:hypothetical protein
MRTSDRHLEDDGISLAGRSDYIAVVVHINKDGVAKRSKILRSLFIHPWSERHLTIPGLRCTLSLVTAAYPKVRLVPQDSRASSFGLLT